MPKTKSSKGRKMTIGYWNKLSEGSRKRALQYCFPTLPVTVDMLLHEKPTAKEVKERGEYWWFVFSKVRIPNGTDFYKTQVGNTYLP